MTHKHMKRCSWLLIFREIEIKIAMRYHLTSVRIAIITKPYKQSWRRCGGKGTHLHCWWEWMLIQPLWRILWRFLKKKIQIKLPFVLAIPLLGTYPTETRIEKHTCTTMFIVTLFTIARTWKQPRCPSADEGLKKLWYIYAMEFYPTINKEWIWVSCNELDNPRNSYKEWSKSEREGELYINAYIYIYIYICIIYTGT